MEKAGLAFYLVFHFHSFQSSALLVSSVKPFSSGFVVSFALVAFRSTNWSHMIVVGKPEIDPLKRSYLAEIDVLFIGSCDYNS